MAHSTLAGCNSRRWDQLQRGGGSGADWPMAIVPCGNSGLTDSYTHMTLPTNDGVEIAVDAVTYNTSILTQNFVVC